MKLSTGRRIWGGITMKSKSKIYPVLIAALLVLVLAYTDSVYFADSVSAAGKFEGSGEADDPFLINTKEDLLLLADNVNNEGLTYEGCYFEITNDIDLQGVDFTPIGIYGSGDYFYGILDGNGYTIKNLTINIPSDNNGLFGMLGGTVVNLKIDGGSITGACCGIIASHATDSSALIVNCKTSNITVNATRAGGIADNFIGSIKNCVSENCELNGTKNVGGIVSHASDGSFFSNYYSFSTKTAGAEIVASDCEVISELDTQSVADTLNKNYRIATIYPADDFGICNLWTVDSSDNLDISTTKQRDEFTAKLSELSGDGSSSKPYIISNVEELVIFRDAVNSGIDFYGQYVRQTEDIDLSGEVWTPISKYSGGKYFYGTYDGAGHVITELNTVSDGSNGFFGKLGGTVLNLGIESGTIQGSCCGGITSHSVGSSAMIVNCFNKATVNGTTRAGGIADNFSGSIIGCWSDCELNSKTIGGISSYSAATISYCWTSAKVVVPEDTMTGEVVESYSGVSFSGDNLQSIAENLSKTMSEVKTTSGVSEKLYTFKVGENGLAFSGKTYRVGVGTWIKNHHLRFAFLLALLIVYACLVLKIGPKKFYEDDRKWWKRFVLVLAPVFLLFYMFFVHSPIEFFLVNNSEFDFVLGDFVWKYIGITIIGTLVISGLLSFIKGKACDTVACAVLGFDLCLYIQLNFMNGSLGLLDGTTKAQDITGNYVNAVLWVIIFLVPFVMLFVLKEYRRKIIIFLCAALCVMQITSITVLTLESPSSAFKRETSEYYLTSNDQFTVSANENIIILVIDTYCNTYINEFFETYPETKSIVKDFTYYNNTDCHYEGSVFSINYIASGTEWNMSVPIDEWCSTAWDNDRNNNFYSRLAEKDYIFNIYTNEIKKLSVEAKADSMGKIHNMVEIESDYIINDKIMLDLFVNASLYRFAPRILKSNLEFTAGDYDGAYKVINKSNSNINTQMSGYADNEEFYKDLLSKGLSTDDEHNYYILQHLKGVHGPYQTNEQCETVEEATLLETERGCWLYIEEYINQLKELGVYDDATIIITADHGEHHGYYNAQPIFFIKTPGETHDQYVETNAPISFMDIMPTIAYLIGEEYSDLGTTIFEHVEDEQRERTLYVRKYDESLPDVPKRDSPTNSILNCFYKYVYTGDLEDLRALGENGPTEKVPWTDSFY